MSIIYKRTSTNEELQAIIELQSDNMPSSISKEEREKEGFLSVGHTFEVLKAMHDACPHIIATHNDKVVGYVLSMLKDFRNAIALLEPMFVEIDTCINSRKSYIVMGQVCVDKSFRKQGIFRGLYNFMQLELNTNFNLLITEVDSKNIRSLNAHKAIGFKELKKYVSNNQEWVILSWDW